MKICYNEYGGTMASIKDAVEESFQDNGVFLKIVVYSILPFLIVNFSKESLPGYVVLTVIAAFLLFGFMLKCTYNVIAGNNEIMPSFNILSVFWIGLKGIIALLPVGIISYFLGALIIMLFSKFIPSEDILRVFSYIISAICASFAYTSYLLYSNRFKIADAYNFNLISKYCIDILLAVIFMYVQLALFNIIIGLPLGYLLWLFLGIQNPITIFIFSMLSVFNLAVMGHYLAQVSYEIIAIKEKEED